MLINQKGRFCILRRLPNLLCHSPRAFVFGYIVDWLIRGLPSFLRRHHRRDFDRCGLLPEHCGHRRYPDCPRNIHNISVQCLLAGLLGARRMQWLGQWTHLHPSHDTYLDLLHDETSCCVGYRSLRKHSWRAHLSKHGENASAHNWLRMDDASHWIHSDGNVGTGSGGYETQGQASSQCILGRLECLQGS